MPRSVWGREREVCVFVRGKASVGNMPSVRDRKEGQLLYASEREIKLGGCVTILRTALAWPTPS